MLNEPQRHPQSGNPVAELPTPGAPADQGLSSLGLLMQLAGSLLLAFGAMMLFITLIASQAGGRGEVLWMFAIFGASMARSLVHRQAGTELLYGRRGYEGGTSDNPLAGLKRYIAVGFIHTIVIVVIMVVKFKTTGKIAIACGLGLALWPAVLMGMLMTGRFHPFRNQIPVSEDKGFEGAGIMMTVFGIMGALVGGTVLLMMLKQGGAILSQGPGMLLLIAVVLLVIRSIMHLQAGISSIGERSVDRSVELANRYANFGLISSFCVAAAFMLLMMTSRIDVFGLAVIAILCWMLMAWPMIIRRFFSDRQFADLLAGDQTTNPHRRAPDAGLTGLGWLLLAWSVYSASFLVPQLIVGPGNLPEQFDKLASFAGPLGVRSMWWNAGQIALQAWAGYELIRMGKQHRIIANAYAVAATALAIYLYWPMIKLMMSTGLGRMMNSDESIIIVMSVGVALVLPIATLLLVNRKIVPASQARVHRA